MSPRTNPNMKNDPEYSSFTKVFFLVSNIKLKLFCGSISLWSPIVDSCHLLLLTHLDMLGNIELLNDVFDKCECEHEVAGVFLSIETLNETKDEIRRHGLKILQRK